MTRASPLASLFVFLILVTSAVAGGDPPQNPPPPPAPSQPVCPLTPSTTCINSGHIIVDRCTAEPAVACVGDLIQFTMQARDSGGTTRYQWPDDHCQMQTRTETVYGGTRCSWTLYQGSQVIATNQGCSLQYRPTAPGVYKCVFRVQADRDCAPPSAGGEATVLVGLVASMTVSEATNTANRVTASGANEPELFAQRDSNGVARIRLEASTIPTQFKNGTNLTYKVLIYPGSQYTVAAGALTNGVAEIKLSTDLIRLPLVLYCRNSPVARAMIYCPTTRLVTDGNHDRVIDYEELSQRTSRTNRFWVNDDDDRGDDLDSNSDDLPGSGDNAQNEAVDGRRDLIDFFPVWVDAHRDLSVLQQAGKTVEVFLKHADGALNAVWTDLDFPSYGNFLVGSLVTGFGPDLAQPPHEATVQRVTAAGLKVPPSAVEMIRTSGKGVVWLEARSPTTKPLVLEIREGTKVLSSVPLPLSISSVEDMYRWMNLRNYANDDPAQYNLDNVVKASNFSEVPPNWPDDETSGKEFVSVHGYNGTENDARRHHSEMVKRLYWSGFRGKYVGVAWWGNESYWASQDFTPDYHENVINAFQTAPALAFYLQQMGNVDVICAHSLGNMVVSSAIQDHGLQVGQYFALNAAVAMEAYDPGSVNFTPPDESSTAQQLMIHDDWRELDDRLYAWSWHELFGPEESGQHSTDLRYRLTWRDRFRDVAPKMRNYYSSGEEVLNNSLGDSPNTLEKLWDLFWDQITDSINHRERVWYTQEIWKGRTAIDFVGDQHGGWGKNVYWIGYSPDESASITEPELIFHPYFMPFATHDQKWGDYRGDWLFRPVGDATANFEASKTFTRAKLLAEAIPAKSLALGRNPLTQLGPDRNINVHQNCRRDNSAMPTWPDRPASGARWLHSDFLVPAYFFNFKLYDDMVNHGGFR